MPTEPTEGCGPQEELVPPVAVKLDVKVRTSPPGCVAV
jgi:hypothetical protein